MKSNNKGFFLAETIVVLSLVTAVMAFVYPNTAKLYDTFKNKAYYYDQTQDVYTLKAIYDADKEKIDENTKSSDDNGQIVTRELKNELVTICDSSNNTNSCSNMTEYNIGDLSELYLTGYIFNSPSEVSDYNFKKYINRIRKTTYDTTAYRLIGVFTVKDSNNKVIETRYATIKIKKPNPIRGEGAN